MFFKYYFIGAFAGLLLSITACNTETVEHRNEQGQLEKFERRKKDFAKEGPYQRFFENGALAEEASYQNDTLEGVRKYYYPSGKLESEENYLHGRLHGKFRKYFESGQLYIEQDFQHGAMNGLSLRFYPNGTLEERVTIRNNIEDGPFTEYYSNGALKTEGAYIPLDGDAGVEQGELKEYNEQGELVRIADCDHGRCITRWKK